MNGLLVLAVAVAVLGCCLVFAVEDDLAPSASAETETALPKNTTTQERAGTRDRGLPAAGGVPGSDGARVLDLRPRLEAVRRQASSKDAAGERPGPYVRDEGGALRTTTLRPRRTDLAAEPGPR